MKHDRDALYAALFLRVALGSLFIAHLYWKFAILPGGLHRWWISFGTNGYYWFVPWYAFSAELVGALLLIPGILTRWACLYTIPLMIGAADFWFKRKGFYFTGAGAELPIVWAVMLTVQAMLGDGPYSVSASMVSRTTAIAKPAPVIQ
jgi:putative oxidoreductase